MDAALAGNYQPLPEVSPRGHRRPSNLAEARVALRQAVVDLHQEVIAGCRAFAQSQGFTPADTYIVFDGVLFDECWIRHHLYLVDPHRAVQLQVRGDAPEMREPLELWEALGESMAALEDTATDASYAAVMELGSGSTISASPELRYADAGFGNILSADGSYGGLAELARITERVHVLARRHGVPLPPHGI